MKQPIFTPAISKCARCGADSDCISWDFDFWYRVMCKNNHVSTKECGSIHRAICKWNNAQEKLLTSACSFGADTV